MQSLLGREGATWNTALGLLQAFLLGMWKCGLLVGIKDHKNPTETVNLTSSDRLGEQRTESSEREVLMKHSQDGCVAFSMVDKGSSQVGRKDLSCRSRGPCLYFWSLSSCVTEVTPSQPEALDSRDRVKPTDPITCIAMARHVVGLSVVTLGVCSGLFQHPCGHQSPQCSNPIYKFLQHLPGTYTQPLFYIIFR